MILKQRRAIDPLVDFILWKLVKYSDLQTFLDEARVLENTITAKVKMSQKLL